jgi:xanthine dehydrogenase accessory factor
MVVNEKGEMAGSISGGCVEGVVVEASLEVIHTGLPRLLHFGVSDEKAWEVGLACGGEIEVFVRCLDEKTFKEIQAGRRRGLNQTSYVVVQGSSELLGREMLYQENERKGGNLSYRHQKQLEPVLIDSLNVQHFVRKPVILSDGTEIEIFIDFIPVPWELIVIGGGHMAIPLVTFANELGFRTVVIDPRRSFGSEERFNHADQLINAWPQRALPELKLTSSTAVAVLTHDPKIDDPALEYVLKYPVFYVGALGSRQTQSDRRKRLLRSGLSQNQVQRIKGPNGLDLGGRTPEEIALAVMAEIVREKNNY